METDAEKLQKVTQKLIDLEVSHQLDRFGGNSKLLREHLATRQLEWSDELHTVTCQGHFIRQPVSEYIEMLRALEPTHFTYEKMGSFDAPAPKVKTIFSNDQAAIDKNMLAIAKGTVVVVDRPRQRRTLAPNEILDTDQQQINANLVAIAKGKKVVVSTADLERGL